MDSFRVQSSEAVDFNFQKNNVGFIFVNQSVSWAGQESLSSSVLLSSKPGLLPREPSPSRTGEASAHPRCFQSHQFTSFLISLFTFCPIFDFLFSLQTLVNSTRSFFFFPPLFCGSKNTEVVHFHFLYYFSPGISLAEAGSFRWPSQVSRMCTFYSYSSKRYS